MLIFNRIVMKEEKIKLDELKVKSFVTDINASTGDTLNIKGGTLLVICQVYGSVGPRCSVLHTGEGCDDGGDEGGGRSGCETPAC